MSIGNEIQAAATKMREAVDAWQALQKEVHELKAGPARWYAVDDSIILRRHDSQDCITWYHVYEEAPGVIIIGVELARKMGLKPNDDGGWNYKVILTTEVVTAIRAGIVKVSAELEAKASQG